MFMLSGCFGLQFSCVFFLQEDCERATLGDFWKSEMDGERERERERESTLCNAQRREYISGFYFIFLVHTVQRTVSVRTVP